MSTLKQQLGELINNSSMPEADKRKAMDLFLKELNQQTNLLIVGATGSGKSSTINALFNMDVAKVGIGVDPETMEIKKFNLNDSLVLWDTPGLGDGGNQDIQHIQKIIRKLQEKDAYGNLLIDLVLVVVDGSTRDLGTTYDVIQEILKAIGNNAKSRVLIAINQCELAMKDITKWDESNHKPSTELTSFLEEKCKSVEKRIKETTGVSITPIYYSAVKKYNLSKLMYFVVNNTPEKKRISYVDTYNKDESNFIYNDNKSSYGWKDTLKNVAETIVDIVSIAVPTLRTLKAGWDILRRLFK